VISFLRCLGILNAAVWFGSAIFFTVAAAPAVFSTEMKTLLGSNNYPYFSGAIAQIIFNHFFFKIQLTCSMLALIHLLLERLYFGRFLDSWRAPLVAFLAIVTLFGGFVARPRLEKLHAIKYAPNTTSAMRDAASQSFRAWHGASQFANLFVLIGLGVYVCRIGKRPD
jgi:hypothetical protein